MFVLRASNCILFKCRWIFKWSLFLLFFSYHMDALVLLDFLILFYVFSSGFVSFWFPFHTKLNLYLLLFLKVAEKQNQINTMLSNSNHNFQQRRKVQISATYLHSMGYPSWALKREMCRKSIPVFNSVFETGMFSWRDVTHLKSITEITFFLNKLGYVADERLR